MSEFDVEAVRRAIQEVKDRGDVEVHFAHLIKACDEIERLGARIELLEKMIATEDWIHEVAANVARKALEDEAE